MSNDGLFSPFSSFDPGNIGEEEILYLRQFRIICVPKDG